MQTIAHKIIRRGEKSYSRQSTGTEPPRAARWLGSRLLLQSFHFLRVTSAVVKAERSVQEVETETKRPRVTIKHKNGSNSCEALLAYNKITLSILKKRFISETPTFNSCSFPSKTITHSLKHLLRMYIVIAKQDAVPFMLN